ncbi:MAG TPA: helix-turn-helix transcriptional regulator [Chitinispirillaceae bacterium]|nr:helix-turn-helix transcriptional regulator [Chitinispirillaceae bacterium]
MMFPNRNELLTEFTDPVFENHPVYSSFNTFRCLKGWNDTPVIELAKLRLEIQGIDYISMPVYEGDQVIQPEQLKFQQNSFRLWYQIDGTGILQNTTRATYGTARPGLLGIIERGERHTYLHQKGTFECFQLLFSLLPSNQAKCYWNSEIEGKVILDEKERNYFENLIFDLILVISRKKEMLGLATISRILEIMVVLFKKGVLLIEDSQFPKNKTKSLVSKAKTFMDLHYRDMHHQEELEKECGVDINYLNIIFRNETGKTLYQYISSVRMEHAKHLLEASGLSVTSIAETTGYPNSNSFTRAFKRHVNTTPHDYRDSFKKSKKINKQ